jgi:hypothetical protein
LPGIRFRRRGHSYGALIQTAKLNGIDPHGWLANALFKIAETPQNQLSELLPWNSMSDRRSLAAV